MTRRAAASVLVAVSALSGAALVVPAAALGASPVSQAARSAAAPTSHHVTAGSAAQRSNLPGVSTAKYVRSFVTRKGSRLRVAGKPFRFAGANGEFLALRNYGPIPSDGHTINSESYPTKFEIDDEFATLHEMGATVVRAQTVGDTIGCALCIEPTLGKFNPRAFAAMDLVVAAAHRYGIKLIGEFAGDANGTAPYGSSESVLKGLIQSTDWYCVWSHVAQSDCDAATFDSPQILADYRRHMRAVLDHVNPYTGLAYKNDPIFLGWVDGNNLGLLNGTPLATYRTWLRKVSATFKATDHKQLFIDNSVYGADYLPASDSGGLNPDYGPTPPKSVIDLPHVDVFAQEWYPKDFSALDPSSPAATQLHVNAKAVAADGKVYAVIEYGWDHYNATSQSVLRRFLARLAKDRNVSGDLYWDLVAHSSGHGWMPIPVNLHCKPTCVGFEDDGNWWAMYYTGRSTASNTAPDMAARAQILRAHAYQVDGFAHAPAHETPPPPVITSAHAGRVRFEGSAGARDYSVQKYSGGRWVTRCRQCTTDNDDGWKDKGAAGCYRVIAFSLSARPSDPSEAAGRGCPSADAAHIATRHATGHWVGSWSASPVDPGPLAGLLPDDAGTGGLTVRDVVHTTLGGRTIRIRLSNLFGTGSARFTDVRVALADGMSAATSGTARRVRFGAHTAVSVAKGAQVTSDPVRLAVRAGQDVAVSAYSPHATGTVTVSGSLNHTNYLSAAGDATAAKSADDYPSATSDWYWLTGVDVLSPNPVARAVVALGDSITAGYASTQDANQDWVDLLANRLRAAHPGTRSVLSAAIAGNNLHENTACFGQSAVHRLTRDALDQPGARYIVVDEGDNDITQPSEPATASLDNCVAHHKISAAGMIMLFKQIARRIHARHDEAVGVTLSPFGRYEYWSPAIETERQTINRWIRTTHVFDGIIDFDRVLRDPSHTTWLSPRYDSGDGLHPNNAGHAAMARSIHLSLFG